MKILPPLTIGKLLILAQLALAVHIFSFGTAGVCFAVQNGAVIERSHALSQKSEKTEPLKLDELAVNWKSDTAKMIRGLKLAEAFRLSLLKVTEGAVSSTPAEMIGDLLEAVRTQNIALEKRPDLSGFTVTSKEFVAQLKGQQQLNAATMFRDFSGRWFGVWDKQTVNHHWHEPVFGNGLEETLKNKLPELTGYQYAWIGDGFGWNYLVEPEQAAGQVVLGFVHHLKPFHPTEIRSDFPLVGFKDVGQRLIWVTAGQVFFEEVITDSAMGLTKDGEPLYSITGFNYSWKEGAIIASPLGFQAVYSNSSDNRPEFLHFKLAAKQTPE